MAVKATAPNAEEVYDPNGARGLNIIPAPEDMVACSQATPYLKTEKLKPASVGARRARGLTPLSQEPRRFLSARGV